MPGGADSTEHAEDYKVTRADMPVTDLSSRVTSAVPPRRDMPGSTIPMVPIDSAGGFGGDSVSFSGVSDTGRLPTIEGYQVVRRLGRGGMGVVFEGVQEATGRRVAIKFMLDSIVASDAARKRFEREVEVVAALQHPGIVSVVDSGVRKGRYYYVMDFVDGRPLDEALIPGKCDRDQALTCVALVCDAMDYAHQRGVLHRDLKPSNILVDDHGIPRLLDFGLAKRLDDHAAAEAGGRRGLTIAEPGQVLGTIAYMSPEQSTGKAELSSIRSDVYSLGVIAYELLAGRLPVDVDTGSFREILSRIAEQDPKPPSVYRPGLSKDIDAVLLRCLDKHPDTRYPTAAAFADEIRRVLAGMPVQARRTSVLGRGWKWCKRNRTLAAVITAAAVMLVSVSAFLIARIIEERDRANANAEATTLALAESLRNERYASQNFNLLRSILESADPDRAGELTVRQFLDSATATLDKTPPDLDLTEASVREILGLVYRKFGDYDKSERNLTRALAIREKNPATSAEVLAETLHNLAATLWWSGSYDSAEKLYRRSLEMRRKLHAGDHRVVATSMTHLAACFLRMGKLEDARDLYMQALEMRRRLFGDEHEEVAQALNNLAKTDWEAERYDEAERLFRESLEMIVRLKGERHSGTASASQNLAQCLLERGDASGAKEAYQRAYAIRNEIFTGGHHLVAASLVGLAQAELALGHISEAERLVAEGLEMHKKRGQPEHPDFAEALATRASALARTGRFEQAEADWREALRIVEKVKPPALLQLSSMSTRLGEALLKADRRDEARPLLERGLELARAQRGDRSRFTSRAAEPLLRLYDAQGDTRAAEAIRPLVVVTREER